MNLSGCMFFFLVHPLKQAILLMVAYFFVNEFSNLLKHSQITFTCTNLLGL
jgi:hypothetical protein